jgi:hypothetical protein
MLRGCLIAFIVVTSVLLIVIAGAIILVGPLGKALNGTTSTDHTVTFKVTTTAKTVVSYGTDGAMLSETVTSAWTKDETVTGGRNVAMALIVDGGAPATATATCEILIDGKNKDKATVTGPSAAGSCSAST